MRVGPHVYVAGTTATATDASGNIVGVGDVRAQTQQTLRNIQSALEKAGARIEHVVRTRIFITNIDDREIAGGFSLRRRAGLMLRRYTAREVR